MLFSRASSEHEHSLEVTARNAETLSGLVQPVTVSSMTNAELTIGGRHTQTAERRGRPRTGQVHVDVQRRKEPVDQVRTAVHRARRVAGAIRNRIG